LGIYAILDEPALLSRPLNTGGDKTELALRKFFGSIFIDIFLKNG